MKLLLLMAPTVLLVVYSQLMTTWRVRTLAAAATEGAGRLERLLTYLCDPFILSAYAAALAGAVAWMFVVERYSISIAFPVYIGITVALVTGAGTVLFGEHLSAAQITGIVLICAGVAIANHA